MCRFLHHCDVNRISQFPFVYSPRFGLQNDPLSVHAALFPSLADATAPSGSASTDIWVFRVANSPSQWVFFQAGCCSLRSPRTVHPFARKGRLFGTSTLPLGRPLSPSVLHLRITALSVPLSSTSPLACQSLSRPPLHRPISPSLVHLSTGLSVPLSSTSPQTCQSLSRPPTSPQVCQSLSRLPLHMSVSPSLVHLSTDLSVLLLSTYLSTGLSVPLSSTSPQPCQSLSRPTLHRPVSPSLVHLSTDLSVPLSSTSSQVCQSLSRPPTSPQTYQSLARPHLHTSPHPMRLSLHMNRGCLVGDSLSLHSVFCRASPCIDSCALLTVLSSKNLPVLNTLSSEVASLH